MIEQTLVKSPLDPAGAAYRKIVGAGDYWIHEIEAGRIIRIADLEGNQAVDTIFYSAGETSERYSAIDTIVGQRNIYLTTGTVLRSNLGNPMLTVTADTCGRHDTLGGACAAESNQVRYAIEKRHMHACRNSFLLAIADPKWNLTKRDLAPNINFFMNVPVTPEGRLTFEDGISEAGKYVEMRAEMNVICVISNCPQLNNPCNAYNPTPIEVLIWDCTKE
jgi:urea carboxylase-associated protein 1